MKVYEVTFEQKMNGNLKPAPYTKVIEKKEVLQNFTPNHSLWITADIKSRLFILNYLKKKHSDVHSSSVKRAGDFWLSLLRLTYPESSIVERPFLTFIYQEWAKSKKQEWQRGLKTGNLICQYMSALTHLLKHPLRENLMEEWAKTFPKTTLSKMGWYRLSADFYDYLKQKKIIESSWAGAFLLDQIPFEKGFLSQNGQQIKNIVFDLGFDTNKLESELIRQIADRINTKILVPICFDGKHQKDIQFLYGWIPKKVFKEHSIIYPKNKTCPNPNSLKIKKFATPLSEVKDIAFQIKQALRRGVKPNRISVLAPYIEDYWPCLKSYFKKEDIPVNKSETISLSRLPDIQLWLAKLRTHLGELKYDRLKLISSHQNRYVNFSQLKSEFYYVREIEKWPPGAYEKNLLRKKEDLVLAIDFTQWAKTLLPSVSASTRKPVTECLKSFSSTRSSLKTLHLNWSAWLSLLEYFILKKEIEIKSGNLSGINCLSFNALSWVDSDLIYIAGLSEQNMRVAKQSLLSALEAHSFTKDLGFFIKTEPADKLENIISCFIHQEQKDLILSFSSTDFLGTALNPSCLYLEKATEHKKDIRHFDIPGITLWDEQQRKPSVQEILSHHNMEQSQLKLIEQSLEEEKGYKNPAPFFQKEIKRLSPSSLESYIKCPFIFAAQKVFHLWDRPKRDMDIPALEKGSLIHKLFEILKVQIPINRKEEEKQAETNKNIYTIQESLSEQEIEQIIENLKNNKSLKPFIQKIHPLIWKKEKARLLKKALNFLKEEKRRKEFFKNYKTIACEKDYQCYWSFKTKSLSDKGDILFTGKIDRLDSDNQSYQIIDYKGTLPSGSIAPSWEKEKNFQLAFYIQVIEQGLADLPILPVKSALYLSYKNFEYQGLAFKEPDYISLLGSNRKKSLISEQEKQTILKKVNQATSGFIENIYEGHFPAKPKTKTFCEECRWNKICRASHLN